MFPAVLLAGGRGTRVASITDDHLPKAMLPVLGRPFVDYKLRQLALAEVAEVVLLVGHAAPALRDHVGDGSQHGLRVTYVSDPPELLGTGGALRAALPQLPEAFWLSYADSYLPVEMAPIAEHFRHQDAPALMTVLRNEDRWGPSNVAVENGRVSEYRKGAPPGTFRFIDYGLLVLRGDVLQAEPEGERFDLSDVFRRLIADGRLAAYDVHERFYDIGAPEALEETERFFRQAGIATRLGLER